MSLKAFHIVFVTASTLLAAGVGGWALGPGESPLLGVVALGAAAALPIYGKWFLAKMKDVSYL